MKLSRFAAIALSLLLAVPAFAQVKPGQIGPSPYFGLSIPVNVQMPSALSWDMTRFPLAVSLLDVPGIGRDTGFVFNPSTGSAITAESLFNSVSTALSAPGETYYVSTTGNDSNACTSSGSPCLTINHAITLANTANVPSLIYVAAGIYPRSGSPGGTSGVVPSVDIAFVCTGGVCTTGTFDLTGGSYPTFTADGTYTNTFSASYANIDRVLDLSAPPNQYGNQPELTYIASASGSPAIVNRTPNSWTVLSGTMYINRADGATPTSSNTRILRAASYTFQFSNKKNVYIGDGGNCASFPACSWDVEGATTSTQSGLSYQIASPTNTIFNVVAVKNSRFRYAGGAINTAGKNIGIESLNGLAAFFNTDADAAVTDGFNEHDTNAAGETLMLTVNCTANDNGRYPGTSNNGLTNHDTAIMIDVAGSYNGNHGGTVRSVGNAEAWLVGSLVQNDLGDLAYGGSIPPDAISNANNVIYWLDRVKVNMSSGTNGIMTESNTSTIYMRNVWTPPGAVVGGPGTIATY
jgi:hypothetical protein